MLWTLQSVVKKKVDDNKIDLFFNKFFMVFCVLDFRNSCSQESILDYFRLFILHIRTQYFFYFLTEFIILINKSTYTQKLIIFYFLSSLSTMILWSFFLWFLKINPFYIIDPRWGWCYIAVNTLICRSSWGMV